MSSFATATTAADSFEEFCVNTPADKMVGEPACLLDFVEAWVESGEGVRICHGDYHTYTVALIGIIDKWIRYPGITDYVTDAENPEENSQVVERRVDSIFRPEGRYHRAFDQYWFETVAFVHLNPHLKRPSYL